MFLTSGRKKTATGKDLTAVKYIVGTGGALTKLPGRKSILRSITTDLNKTKLVPNSDAIIWIDNHYVMASLGVMSKNHMEACITLLRESLKLIE